MEHTIKSKKKKTENITEDVNMEPKTEYNKKAGNERFAKKENASSEPREESDKKAGNDRMAKENEPSEHKEEFNKKVATERIAKEHAPLEHREEFTLEEAKSIGTELGTKWDKFSVEQFRNGMNVELENAGQRADTDISNDDDPHSSGKMALAHLNESADYYSKTDRATKETV